MTGYNIHLVGSIPLRNATEVFETVSAALGPQLLRIPDGETGERAGWMGWLAQDFQSHPDLEPTDEIFRPHAAGRSTIRYRLKPSARAKQIAFDDLRHASVAIESYELFVQLKKAGKVPTHCRYQFAMAHPISVTNHYAVASAQDAIEHSYERGLIQQITKMLAVIPPEDLAIQWDLGSAVFALLQLGTPARHGATKQEMLDTTCASCVRIGNAVPTGVDLLYHLCYGDSGPGFPETYRSCRCRRVRQSSIPKKISGSSCDRTGCRTESLNPSTTSSITAATLGTPLSISLGKS
jgi:hypothetical protein